MTNTFKYLTLFVLVAMSSVLSAQNLAVTNVIRPLAGNLNCTAIPVTDSIEVRIANLGASPESNFQVSFQLNNGSVITENFSGTITNGGNATFTFSSGLSITTGGLNTLKVFTSLAGDVNRANDTINFNFSPRISSFPYLETFESDNGGFSAGGTNSTWVWGARNKAKTGQSGEGTKCWTNGGLTGYYSNSDASYLRTPCYDFSNLSNPYIAFQFLVEVEYNYEVVSFQYSTNGGSSWQNLGANGDPDDCETQNWYNNGRPGWSGNASSYPCSFGWGGGCNGKTYCGKWREARKCLSQLAGEPNVMFQWRFTSTGTQCTSEGFAVDSLVIGEAPSLNPFVINFQDSVCPGVPISFTSTLSSCYQNPRWDFGDGSGEIQSASTFHAYRTGGNFNVKLIVDGLCGKVDTLTKTLTILPPPTVNIDSFNPRQCLTGPTVNLSATPNLGTFYVDNVQQNSFDPSALGLGKHTAIYRYTDTGSFGCTAEDTVLFDVYLPVASINNLGGQYCPSAPAFVLTGTPAGGTFFINGNQDSLFSPSALGIGSHSVTYTYTDSNSCPASVTKNVSINNSLVVQINAIPSFYCKGDSAVNLTATPLGGVFRVNGQIVTQFLPSLYASTSGQDTISYFYTDGSCSNSDTVYVDVINNNPGISGVTPNYCYNSSPVNPVATPAGGSLTLDGNTVFGFDPAQLSIGNHTLKYYFLDPTYNCLDSAVENFQVEKPQVSINNILPNYCIDRTPIALNSGTPSGGTYTIDNSAATEINPAALGLGAHQLIYTYTNSNACTYADTFDFSIEPLPTPQFIGLPKTLCFNSPAITIQTNPSGGVISIDGLPGSSQFDPSLYQSNTYHIIEYQYVDFNYGCAATIRDSIFIGVPPNVSIQSLNGNYCNTDEDFILQGMPGGGQFLIDGNPATSFNPKTVGIGNHTVEYIYQDANGCQNQLTQLVEVVSNPGDTIYPGPVVEICLGEEVILNVNGSLAGTWSTNETSKSITVKPVVSTNYWYRVDACAEYFDSVLVVVNQNPIADFTINPDQGFAPLDITAINASQNAGVKNWLIEGTSYLGDTAKHTLQKPGEFEVTLYVENSSGCLDSIVKSVKVFEGIRIPNVFTPNDDKVNDNFGPITQSSFSEYEFRIYDRWGKLMFISDSPNERWDGTFNNQPVPEGTYFYLLVAKNLKEFKLEGTVNLIR